MTIGMNARLSESARFIQASPPNGDLTGALWVSLKNYQRVCVIIDAAAVGGLTGGVVTLNQAKTVAGGSAKAAPIASVQVSNDVTNAQTEAGQALVDTPVVNNTFTVTGGAGKKARYIFEIDVGALDINNGFDCVRVVSTALGGGSGSIDYIVYGPRYSGAPCMTD